MGSELSKWTGRIARTTAALALAAEFATPHILHAQETESPEQQRTTRYVAAINARRVLLNLPPLGVSPEGRKGEPTLSAYLGDRLRDPNFCAPGDVTTVPVTAENYARRDGLIGRYEGEVVGCPSPDGTDFWDDEHRLIEAWNSDPRTSPILFGGTHANMVTCAVNGTAAICVGFYDPRLEQPTGE